MQAAGIVLTFLGLYLYDRTSDAAKADRKAKLEQLRLETPLLPTYVSGSRGADGQSVLSGALFTSTPLSAGYRNANGSVNGEEKKFDAAGPGRPSEGAQGWRGSSPIRRADEPAKGYG